jgi:hypothetical protein
LNLLCLVLRFLQFSAKLGKLLAPQLFEFLPLLSPALGQRLVGFLHPALGALQIGLLGHAAVQEADRQHTDQRSDASHMPCDIHSATFA